MDVRLLKLSGVDLNQSWEKVLEELQMKNVSLLDRIGTSQDPVQREKLQILQGQIEALCEEIDQILSTAVSLDPQRANTAPRDDGAKKRAEAKERAEAEARAAEEKKQAEAKARAAAQTAAPAKAAQAAPKPAPPPAPKKPALSPEMEEAKAQFSLGQKLLSGRGVDKNPVLAAELFRKAAEAGWLEAQYQLGRLRRRMVTSVKHISDEALALLMDYEWPGNVRELNNILERAVNQCGGDTIRPEHLGDFGPRPVREPAEDVDWSLDAPLEDVRCRAERNALRRALEKAGGNRTRAAALLKISRTSFYEKAEKYHLWENEQTYS